MSSGGSTARSGSSQLGCAARMDQGRFSRLSQEVERSDASRMRRRLSSKLIRLNGFSRFPAVSQILLTTC